MPVNQRRSVPVTGPRNARLRRLLQPDAWPRLDMRSACPLALWLPRHGSRWAGRRGSLPLARRRRHGPARGGPGSLQTGAGAPGRCRWCIPCRRPRVVGVVLRHRLPELLRFLAAVLLEDDPLRPDDERHDAALAVLRGIRDQREAAGHLSVLDVALRAAGSRGALGRQNAVEVAVVGSRALPALARRVAFRRRVRHQRTEGAPVCGAGLLPVESVVLAGLARNLLRVDPGAAPGAILGGVLALGIDVGACDGDGRQLVAADAAIEELVRARGRVEAPLVAALHQRDRQRPRL